MDQHNFYPEFPRNMFGNTLCRINGTMLTTRTPKSNHQISKVPIHIPFDMIIHQRINGIEKFNDFSIFFQKPDHRFIQTIEIIIPFKFPGIINSPAIKHISASITRRIVRNPFLISKTYHPYLQFTLLTSVNCLSSVISCNTFVR